MEWETNEMKYRIKIDIGFWKKNMWGWLQCEWIELSLERLISICVGLKSD